MAPSQTGSQLNHIHSGRCGVNSSDSSLGSPVHTLTGLVNGQGTTVLTGVTIASLRASNHAINVHKSGEPSVYTACGDIPNS